MLFHSLLVLLMLSHTILVFQFMLYTPFNIPILLPELHLSSIFLSYFYVVLISLSFPGLLFLRYSMFSFRSSIAVSVLPSKEFLSIYSNCVISAQLILFQSTLSSANITLALTVPFTLQVNFTEDCDPSLACMRQLYRIYNAGGSNPRNISVGGNIMTNQLTRPLDAQLFAR